MLHRKKINVSQEELITMFGQSAATLYGIRNALEVALDAMQGGDFDMADDTMMQAYDMCSRMVAKLDSHVSRELISTPAGETVH